jgi:hypothetical protein
MPSRFDSPEGTPPNPQQTGVDGIDLKKRYDVYCHRHGHSRLMVYRDVLFKRAAHIFEPDNPYSRIGEFLELQDVKGRTFCVSRVWVIAFCEHGTELPGESIALD